MHPATAGLLRYFEYGHLPERLQATSKPIGDLARQLAEALPDGPEKTTGLRKLLEAKDCFVRAALDTPDLSRPVNGPQPAPGRPGKGQSWFRVDNLGQNSAEVWLYTEIGAWGIRATDLVAEIAGLNVAEITVHVNSPGGDVFDGIAIMNALRDHPANVTVQVDALAASIASVIAQAGNTVIMGRNSTMMIHNASGFAMGEAKDLRKMADLLESTTKNIASIYAERAGGAEADWLAAMDEETWYGAEEAVAAGLADSVAPLAGEREAHDVAARFDLSVFNRAPERLPDPDPDAPPAPVPPPAAAPVLAPVAGLGDLLRASVAEAVPKPVEWDPDLFKTAVGIVATSTPAPPPVPPLPPAPDRTFNPTLFAQAIREART